MDGESHSTIWIRQTGSALLGLTVVFGTLCLTYKMVLSGGILGSMGASAMPLVAGLLVGLVLRYSCMRGSFGLASFGMILVLFSGLVCSAMRHKIWFDSRLDQDAAAAYEETLAYAKNIVPEEADDERLRRFMTNNEVSVIGRITPVTKHHHYRYWEIRNFIHLHWVAARRIVFYGQGGVDKTIAIATGIIGDDIFMDKYVSAISTHEPVTDDDIKRFRQYELPFLKQMNDGEITRQDFVRPLVEEIHSRIGWNTFATNGFEPFLGMAMIFGGLVAYKLIRQPDEMEMI